MSMEAWVVSCPAPKAYGIPVPERVTSHAAPKRRQVGALHILHLVNPVSLQRRGNSKEAYRDTVLAIQAPRRLVRRRVRQADHGAATAGRSIQGRAGGHNPGSDGRHNSRPPTI